MKKISIMKKISVMIMTMVMIAGMSSVSLAASNIGSDGAIKKALKSAGVTRSEVRGLECESDDGKYEIEFTKKSNKAEYDFEISKSGRILEKSVDYKYKHNYSSKKIGKKAARKKVARAANTSVSVIKKGSCWYERDDGEGRYEVQFTKGKYSYDYELLAPTGKIIEYSKKYIG